MDEMRGEPLGLRKLLMEPCPCPSAVIKPVANPQYQPRGTAHLLGTCFHHLPISTTTSCFFTLPPFKRKPTKQKSSGLPFFFFQAFPPGIYCCASSRHLQAIANRRSKAGEPNGNRQRGRVEADVSGHLANRTRADNHQRKLWRRKKKKLIVTYN